MSKYEGYISGEREPKTTPEAIVENGKAHFGTFDKPFKCLNLLDCEQPCGLLLPHFMNKTRLTEWEAFEVNMKNATFLVAVYNNMNLFGFTIFVFHDKEENKLYSWMNKSPIIKTHVAEQLLDGVSYLKTKNSELKIENDLGNGKARATGFSKNNKTGEISLDISVERLSPPSNVSIPFGKNKPLYSEKDFFKATGKVTLNGKEYVTDENSVSIIDDHKGYYPRKSHYDWLTTMGKTDIDGQQKFFAFNLTRNQSINQNDYNENLIWLENEQFPLPPVVFTHDKTNSALWYVKDEFGTVDIRFEIEKTFEIKTNCGLIKLFYELPFGKIYGFVKDTNGKKYTVDGMTGIGEDKSTVL